MKKFEIVLSIEKFLKENRLLKMTDLRFNTPLVISDDGITKLVIDQYYEYDVTIFVYKDSKREGKYQEYYDDLPMEVLEKIYNQVKKLSTELKSESEQESEPA